VGAVRGVVIGTQAAQLQVLLEHRVCIVVAKTGPFPRCAGISCVRPEPAGCVIRGIVVADVSRHPRTGKAEGRRLVVD